MLPPSSLHEYLQLHHRTPCTPSCTTSDIERAKAMALELQDEQRTIRIKTRPFDMANYLGSEAEITEYLRQALEDGDPAELAAALGDIARARGMTQLARDTGLSRESLYESLSGERARSSETLFQVIRAMGYKLSLQARP